MWGTKWVFVGDAVTVSKHANTDILTSGVRVRHREKQENSPQLLRRPVETIGGETPRVRNFSSPSLPRFSAPAPVSTPLEPRVWAGWGGTWVIGEEGNTIQDTGSLCPVNLLNPGGGGSFEARGTLPSTGCSRTATYWSFWIWGPPLSPLYPGASADYSSPPCCVSVCIGRMGSGRQGKFPGQAPSLLHAFPSVANSDPWWRRTEPTLLWRPLFRLETRDLQGVQGPPIQMKKSTTCLNNCVRW